MPAQKYHIYVEKGAKFELLITYKNEDGTLFDLTDYFVRMEARSNYSSSKIPQMSVNSSLIAGGRATLGGVLGTITIVIDAVDTAAITATGEGVYDIELVHKTLVPEDVARILQGRVVFLEEVTKDG